MQVILGGPGSSGSSLLSEKLRDAVREVSLPELSLFNKPTLYNDWERAKFLIVKNSRRLETQGWFPYPRTRISSLDLGWTEKEINEMIVASRSLIEFSDLLFSKKMSDVGANGWIEKTPSNAYCFDYFLAQRTNNRVILCVRNPYDTVASLVNRGMSPYFAAGLWLYNTVAALRCFSSDRFLLVRYEDLLSDPDEQISRICSFANLNRRSDSDKKAENIDDPGGVHLYRKIESWKFDPSGAIAKSNSTFDSFDEYNQSLIIAAISSIKVRLDDRPVPLKSGWISIPDLLPELTYSEIPMRGQHRLALQGQFIFDYCKRALLHYHSSLSGYPAKLDIK